MNLTKSFPAFLMILNTLLGSEIEQSSPSGLPELHSIDAPLLSVSGAG
jgi:hypothetical protein